MSTYGKRMVLAALNDNKAKKHKPEANALYLQEKNRSASLSPCLNSIPKESFDSKIARYFHSENEYQHENSAAGE